MGPEQVAYFYEREDAEEVARRLAADGAVVRRERFQGEDDDEDHPWVVVLPPEADLLAAEQLVNEYDGWLATPAPPDSPPALPPPLPTAPRRLKGF